MKLLCLLFGHRFPRGMESGGWEAPCFRCGGWFRPSREACLACRLLGHKAGHPDWSDIEWECSRCGAWWEGGRN